MKKWVLFFGGLVLLSSVSVQARDCFSEHLHEAMAVNRIRMGHYALLSQNRSLEVSKQLIRLEKLSVPFASYMDKKAGYFQKRGIPVFCPEFVSMSKTPSTQNFLLPFESAPRTRFENFSSIRASFHFGRLVLQEDYTRLKRELLEDLEELRSYPRFFCMVRHTYESALRILHFGKRHANDATSLGLSHSPMGLTKRVLLSHFAALPFVFRLDKKAMPLQEEGLEILCRDVPHLLDEELDWND